MSTVAAQANNKGIIFKKEVIQEYVRGNQFSPYMSSDGMMPIFVMHETGKYGGDQINLPLILALRSSGVGVGTLTGNEDGIDNYGCRVWIDWARNAVKATKNELKKASFDIFAKAKPLLSQWGRTMQRDEITKAFLAIPSESPPANLGSAAGQRINGVLWSAATAAQKNAWVDNNADRVLFGHQIANYVAGSFSSSAANVSEANGKLTPAIIDLLKERAKKSDPRIEPLTTDDGYERYVLFAGTNAVRDLKKDAGFIAWNKDARAREASSYKKNPFFMDGDLLWDGVVIREIPEIDTLLTQAGVGASSINVAPVFLCGKSAIGLTWGQLPEPTKLDDTDYQFLQGVGIEMCYGVGKLFYKTTAGALKDWGVVTGFVSSVPSA